MSRETALAKIASMAQILDDIGLHGDATVMDDLLEAAAAADTNIQKEAGLWQSILSRMGGWARKVLFKEYRQMYNAAREVQEEIDARLEELREANKALKELLAHHKLPDWRENLATLLPEIAMPVDETVSAYDEQHAKMTARLLKLNPRKGKGKKEKPKESAIPPLMPEDEGKEGKSLETAIKESLKPEEGVLPSAAPEEPVPLTTVKRPAPEAVPVPPAAAEPMPGWKKERFGTSGKHGWEWEWEISPEGNRLRLPKNQLAAASSGKGKILHKQDGMYRPTGGTSSVKLRRLMGDTYWKEESDPSSANMVVLVRTEEVVPPPLSLRQEPVEQARKLKELGTKSSTRVGRIIAMAVALGDGDPTDEEKLGEAAEALLGEFEAEEMESEPA